MSRPRSERPWLVITTAIALGVHGLLAVLLTPALAQPSAARAPRSVARLDIEATSGPAEAPPPPALATTSKAAPPAVVAAALPLAKLAAVSPAIAPSPPVAPAALARAGAALTSDHGADALPTGEGAHAGGLTSPAGTSAEPAPPPQKPAPAAADAAPLFEMGAVKVGPSVDRSRPPELASGGTWQCPFPSEAERDGVDGATVALRVSVSADGAVVDVAITQDPGHGFGREARQCARTKRWAPALDRDGRPVAGAKTVNVHFVR